MTLKAFAALKSQSIFLTPIFLPTRSGTAISPADSTAAILTTGYARKFCSGSAACACCARLDTKISRAIT